MKKLFLETATFMVVVAVGAMSMFTVVNWALSGPEVWLDSYTREPVALVTDDGMVQRPPSPLPEVYAITYVAPGYKPLVYGVTYERLRELEAD